MQPDALPAMNPAARLPDEIAAMRALCETLLREQAALAGANPPECEALLGPKAALVAQLSELAALRHRALDSVGASADEKGMQAWLATTPEACAPWETLIGLTREASALNQINGALLKQLSIRNQQALSSLQQHLGSDIYGPAGQAQAIRPGRARAIG